jgi:hypothetical protein
MRRFFTKKYISIASIVGILVVGGFAIANGKKEITITNGAAKISATPKPKATEGTLSGIECENGLRRPVAVMLASDPEARPLAGVGSADMVIEMPVTEGGVTRMMAVFQCGEPREIGSIRSARLDFLPLVQGFNALYVHWGGEHEVLALLDQHVVQNIDCIKLDGTTCQRKRGIPRPHNGYTTSQLIKEKVEALGYSTTKNLVAYSFDDAKSNGTVAVPTLYAGEFAVKWTYDPAINKYTRSRGGTAEIDRLTGNPVQASNIIVLHTTSEYVSILYNRVKTVGSGSATVYHNGISIPATWEKLTDNAKLAIKDASGKEIELTPGSTWWEFVTN